MKVSELTGAQLDLWVARADGRVLPFIHRDGRCWENLESQMREDGTFTPHAAIFEPSSDWRAGGPIIERERIELRSFGETWVGNLLRPHGVFSCASRTALVAAMRAFVASKYGETVPDEVTA